MDFELDKYIIKCENCGDLIDDENESISIENADTHEMLSVCSSCFRQLRSGV